MRKSIRISKGEKEISFQLQGEYNSSFPLPLASLHIWWKSLCSLTPLYRKIATNCGLELLKTCMETSFKKKKKSTTSIIVKSLKKILPLFNSCTCHVVSTRLGINLWSDHWHHNPLDQILIGPLPKNEQQRIVSSIINQNNNILCWDLHNFPYSVP